MDQNHGFQERFRRSHHLHPHPFSRVSHCNAKLPQEGLQLLHRLLKLGGLQQQRRRNLHNVCLPNCYYGSEIM